LQSERARVTLSRVTESERSDTTGRTTGEKIPALVVSGFLGSGKTTLVRHLLEEAQREGIRVAVVSNELGELGIDRALLGQGGEAFIELEGGCVCCELSDDLIQTLQQLHDEFDPDRIVIETSGVALPFDTTLNFWREPVSAWLGDDMAIVVVNAEQLAAGEETVGTFEDQVSSADLLVLNKTDLVDPESLGDLEQQLRHIEPEAPIVRCTQGRIGAELLFPPEAGKIERHGPAPEVQPHDHERFATREWTVPEGITPEQLEEDLSRPGLLRAKGWVQTSEGPMLVQVVGRRIERTAEAPPDPALLGRVILIERASE
jgi:cobalamin biosynthesis protein CobW